MSNSAIYDGVSKKKDKSKNRWRLGFRLSCGSLLIILFIVGCTVITWLGLAPRFVYTLPEKFLPPYCDEILFAQVVDLPAPSMRVIKDLYRQTRVIALDMSGNDICFFRASTNSGAGFWPAVSPDNRYVAFTSNQIISDYDFHRYLFIVDTTDGSYVRFTPDNPEEHIETTKLAWSPDSATLATVSSSTGFCCVPPPNVYMNLMTPSADYIWRVDLGANPIYTWGYVFWSEDGTQINYGHDEDTVWGVGVGQPFWCTIRHTGVDLHCELVNP
jgi:hypothetical protein